MGSAVHNCHIYNDVQQIIQNNFHTRDSQMEQIEIVAHFLDYKQTNTQTNKQTNKQTNTRAVSIILICSFHRSW